MILNFFYLFNFFIYYNFLFFTLLFCCWFIFPIMCGANFRYPSIFSSWNFRIVNQLLSFKFEFVKLVFFCFFKLFCYYQIKLLKFLKSKKLHKLEKIFQKYLKILTCILSFNKFSNSVSASNVAYLFAAKK